jgi:uncharacterized protein
VILYLDTSAVVKLYATEPGSAETEQLVTAARQVASSLIAYAETRAALARKYRMRQMNENDFNARKDEFDHHWAGFFKLPVDAQLVRLAARICRAIRLEGLRLDPSRKCRSTLQRNEITDMVRMLRFRLECRRF